MALKIQIAVMDSKDYIIEYKDFKVTERDAMISFIWEHMGKPDSTKIQIRKWN